jgi:hypothetical protein
VYVADSGNNCIRKITDVFSRNTGCIVSTFAGKGAQKGYKDGPGNCALFSRPVGLALYAHESLIVTDSRNCLLRLVRLSDGHVSTLAGSMQVDEDDTSMFADGSLLRARFSNVSDVAVDERNDIYVADMSNNAIRKVSRATDTVTTVYREAAVNQEHETLNGPKTLAFVNGGNLLVTDTEDCCHIYEFQLPIITSPATTADHGYKGVLCGFSKLWGSSHLADVEFLVQGKKVLAHSQVLTQSDFFYTMLTTDVGTKNNGLRQIPLLNVSEPAFRVILRYFYTHELPESEDCGEGLEVGEMAKAADYYNAPVLCRRCVELFRLNLTPENLMQRLVQAHDLKVDSFVQECFLFLGQHSREFATLAHASLAFVVDRPDLKDLFLEAVQVMTAGLLQ